jgi:hypothetical protein
VPFFFLIEKESDPFNETSTKKYLLKTKGHEAVWQMEEALKRHQANSDTKNQHNNCPGHRVHSFNENSKKSIDENLNIPSRLKNWPIQIHLIPPKLPITIPPTFY